MVVSLPLQNDPYVSTGLFFVCLSVVAVFGRIYTRAFVIRAFRWDDLACIVTFGIALAFDGSIFALWRISNLQPYDRMPPENVLPSIRLVFASLLTYILAATSLKIALAMTLLRVIVQTNLRRAIYAVLTVCIIYGIAFFFLVLFECGTPQNFAFQIAGAKCLPIAVINGVAYTHATVIAITDVIYGVLPIIYLRSAALQRGVKFSVCGILALGSFGCICSFIRIGWISNLTTPNNTYLITSRGIALMSAIELAIGLVCISLVTYKPLILRYLQPHLSHKSDSERGQSGLSTMDRGLSEQSMEREPHKYMMSLGSHPTSPTSPKSPKTFADQRSFGGDGRWSGGGASNLKLSYERDRHQYRLPSSPRSPIHPLPPASSFAEGPWTGPRTAAAERRA